VAGSGRYLVDYHVHPDYSIDAEGAISDHCRIAVARGLGEICFTTHYDADPAYAAQEAYALVRGRLRALSERWLDSYFEDVAAARAAFEPAGLLIRAGLEIDYFAGVEELLAPVVGEYPFDYILGSVHRVDGYQLSTASGSAAWIDRYGPREALARYGRRLAGAASAGLFDCLGHLEVYRRSLRRAAPARPLPADPAEALGPALQEAARCGVGLEVNTRSARFGAQYQAPRLEVLRLARAEGIQVITFGSDAHSPDGVGVGIEAGMEAAREAGFREFCGFNRRRPQARPL
jgi:histidinol-phosphatase (PHP family)